MPDKTVIDAAEMQPPVQQGTNKVLVDLNKIMQQCLLPFGAINQDARPVVRCSSMPEVEADEGVFIHLFDLLIKSILNNPPPGKRLFLHIDCERVKKMPAELSVFEINFYTNVLVTSDWIEKYQQALSICQQQLMQNNAVLKINYPPAHGCLYSLSLSITF